MMTVDWLVAMGDEFEPEFDALPEAVQTELLAAGRLLQHFGPHLGRPRFSKPARQAGSRYSGMSRSSTPCARALSTSGRNRRRPKP